MSGYAFAISSVFEDQAATERLWAGHWSETEVQYRGAPLCPDMAQFRYLHEHGMSVYYAMRKGAELVGHLYFILHTSRHTSTPSASEDFFYIAPEHRLGLNAVRLIRFAVADLRARGLSEIGMSSKLTSGRDISPLLARAGFKHVANYYVFKE